jgi:hypothetical protein
MLLNIEPFDILFFPKGTSMGILKINHQIFIEQLTTGKVWC